MTGTGLLDQKDGVHVIETQSKYQPNRIHKVILLTCSVWCVILLVVCCLDLLAVRRDTHKKGGRGKAVI